MITPLFFALIIVASLAITWWAARRNASSTSHYVAEAKISGWQNGMAITGDFLSAATFLGTTGAIALSGISGFYLVVAVPIAFLLLLLVIAEPLRNLGKFTVADMLATRFPSRGLRAVAAVNTLLVSAFFMIAQFVGGGLLIQLIFGIPYALALLLVGGLMTVYVLFGGMLAVTWIQIVKTSLVLVTAAVLAVMVLGRYGFDPLALLDAAVAAFGPKVVTPPHPPTWARGLDALSYQIAVALGVAGLPHVLIRFLTVPDDRAARQSVAVAGWTMFAFLIVTTIIGYGAALVVGPAEIAKLNPAGTLAVMQLARALAGDVFVAFLSVVVFATVIAVLAGVAIAASGAFAHDLYTNVLRRGDATDRERLVAARIAVAVVCGFAILLSLGARDLNLTFLGSLSLATAASTNFPALLFTVFWRRFNVHGAIWGMTTGLVTSAVLVAISPTVMGPDAWFPLSNPAIVSTPLGFAACILGTLLGRESTAPRGLPYDEILLRAMIRDGAEPRRTA